MATKNSAARTTGVKALTRLRDEREALDRREVEARKDAAAEFGEAVLKASGIWFEPAQVTRLLSAAMFHGFDTALAMLLAPGPADKRRQPDSKPAANGDASSEPAGALQSANQGPGHVT
jgi:hypothetical protein